MNDNQFPTAIEAPGSKLVTLTARMLEKTADLARMSPRGRIIQRLHKTDDAPLQRMLNVMQPGSYARPHRHLDPPKAEAFVMIRGAVRLLRFGDAGEIIDWVDMRAGGELFGVDIEPGVWHSLIVLEADSVIFEVKNGPYARCSDKDFPAWAPPEGSPEAARYLDELILRTGGTTASS
jgi:cupin fold WbuC family metalloprotein